MHAMLSLGIVLAYLAFHSGYQSIVKSHLQICIHSTLFLNKKQEILFNLQVFYLMFLKSMIRCDF